MSVWRAYFDESYNAQTFCVGGFLAPEDRWTDIEEQWSARILAENERSALAGYPPISRYHATDCANLKNEFAPQNGWDVQRQIRFTQRLCEIIDDCRPIGLAVGGRVADIKGFLGLGSGQEKAALYDLCFRMALMFVVATVRDNFPGVTVDVTIDQGKTFGQIARNGFSLMITDAEVPYLKDCFVPQLKLDDSRTCVRLQAADFIAYEAMRQLEIIRLGKEGMRKSMQAIIGTDIPLHISQFTDETLIEMANMVASTKNGIRPKAEDIESGLSLPITSGHRLTYLP